MIRHDLIQPMHLIIILVLLPIVFIPYWKIFKKAGFPGALSLLILVPLVNLILLYVVAFSKWKVVPAQSHDQ